MSTKGKMIVTKKNYKKGYPKKFVTTKQMYKAIHRNIENKMIFSPLHVDFADIPTGQWAEASLMLVSQGTANGQRIGNVIRLKSLEINGVLSNTDHTPDTQMPIVIVRVIIALWAGGTVTTPLQSSTWNLDVPLRTTNAPQGLLKKYYDKYIVLNSSVGTMGAPYGAIQRRFKYFKMFRKGLTIDFGQSPTTTPNKRLIMSIAHDYTLGAPNPGLVGGYWATSYEDA